MTIFLSVFAASATVGLPIRSAMQIRTSAVPHTLMVLCAYPLCIGAPAQPITSMIDLPLPQQIHQPAAA